jgi:hypothetical protein
MAFSKSTQYEKPLKALSDGLVEMMKMAALKP